MARDADDDLPRPAPSAGLGARDLGPLSIDELNVDHTYQRDLDQTLAQKIARDYDIVAVDPIIVSMRSDGSLWIVNGQHRAAAAKITGETEILAYVHHGIDRVDRNPVSPAADAVITFTYDIAEIGFDRFAATLTGCTDGALHLNGIEMDCPEERLRGSGEIAPAAAVPFSKRPLSLDLELSVKGHPAELLSKAGLLSQKKDAAGFAPLKEHVKLGGTLEQIDTGGWHDLLAKAVSQPAPPPKKGG